MAENATSNASAALVYETKLFHVLLSSQPVAEGHVIIQPKAANPHFFSFDMDHLEEYGYLIKKVSFTVMRETRAIGFSLVMNDGTPDAGERIQTHLIPRKNNDNIAATQTTGAQALSAQELEEKARALKELMQGPQVSS